jgi:hypothetical protein
MSDQMKWEDLTESARNTMKELGNFGPTVNIENREVKGYTLDAEGDAGKTYWSSQDLRLMAQDFVEVADWLDKRAIGP